MTVSVQAIPASISQSLSALRNPLGATRVDFDIADKKLGKYENALGITASETATYGQRIEAVAVAAAAAVTHALPEQLSSEDRTNLSLDQLKQYNKDLENALVLLTKLSSIINDQPIADPVSPATVEGVPVEYKDSRPGVSPHRAYVFRVEPSKGTVYEEI
jgi:hypothetical protein